MACSPPSSSVHGILQVRILEWVAILFSRGTSQPGPGIKPQSPALQADSLPSEAPGKPQLYYRLIQLGSGGRAMILRRTMDLSLFFPSPLLPSSVNHTFIIIIIIC